MSLSTRLRAQFSGQHALFILAKFTSAGNIIAINRRYVRNLMLLISSPVVTTRLRTAEELKIRGRMFNRGHVRSIYG
jgi:hypothetical protein